MAASQTTIALRNSSNGEFQAICTFIHNGMIAGGWTEEYSDGDPTTVSAPGQNSWGLTKIYRSPAETGLTRPYLKLRFGSNNNAAPGFVLETQLGWERSGSDLVVGPNGEPVGTATSGQANTTAGVATTRVCTISVNAAEVCICLAQATVTTSGELLAFSRTRDKNNSFAKTDKLIVHRQYPGVASSTYSTRCIDTIAEYANNIIAAIGTQGTPFGMPAGISGGRPAMGFMQVNAGGRVSPLETFLGFETATPLGPVGDLVPIEIYGVERTFIIGNSTSNAVGGYANSSTTVYQPYYLYD